MSRQCLKTYLVCVCSILANCLLPSALSQTVSAQDTAEKLLVSESTICVRTGDIPNEKLSQLESLACRDSARGYVAHQTACFLHLRRGEYRQVWLAMSQLPENTSTGSESLDWGNQRLRLWLAMETHQKEQATELLKAMVRRLVAIDVQLVSIGRFDAEFLGLVCALAKADTQTDRIPEEIVAKSIKALSNHHLKSLATAFQDSYERNSVLVQEIENALRDVSDLTAEALAQERTKVKQEIQQATLAFEDSTEVYLKGKAQLKVVQDGVKNAKKLVKDLVYRLNRTEEPGRPSYPKKPDDPRRDSSHSKDDRTGKGGSEKRTPSEYEMQKYQYDLMIYYRDAATYPARLAEWTACNEARKVRLAQEIENAKKQIKECELKVDDEKYVFGKLASDYAEKEHDQRLKQRRLLAIEVTEVSRAPSATSAPIAAKNPYRPSNFNGIDFRYESDRLFKEVR